MKMSYNHPKIVLFGDSLTQKSFDPIDGRWGALLANQLQRICDVVNRGFSGYNSSFCRALLPKLYSTENSHDVLAFIILIGTNDCSKSEQHVPLPEYKDNLEWIVNYLKEIGISEEKIILICPPPSCNKKYAEFCEAIGRDKTTRDLKVIAQYATACVEIARKFSIDVLDLFNEMLKNQDWQSYLIDGVHFSQSGSETLFELLWPLIDKRIDMTKMIGPYWREFDMNDVKMCGLNPYA